jgi:A/G-specific adenine glycosylase
MTFSRTLQVLNAIRDSRSPRGESSQLRFRRAVRSYYARCGRHFPWRETRDPYAILVSEIMLQQTQTSRVSERFPLFLRRFPDAAALAHASQSEVIQAWEGLGYYRRARNLHRAAQAVVQHHDGVVPSSFEALRSLPGVGAYTAAAVSAFAFDRGVAMIETNIRSVYLYVFCKGRHGVRDSEILKLVEETMPSRNVRDWFYGLMDLGVELKRVAPTVNHASRHHTKQSPFKGSDRQVAAYVLRLIVAGKRATARGCIVKAVTSKFAEATREQVDRALARLTREGLVVETGRGLFRSA